MRVIARRTLRDFVEKQAGTKSQPALKAALDAWFGEVSRANWSNTADIKRLYVTASIVSADRCCRQDPICVQNARDKLLRLSPNSIFITKLIAPERGYGDRPTRQN